MKKEIREQLKENENGYLSVYKDLNSLDINVTVIQARTSTGYKSHKTEMAYFFLEGKGSMIMSGESDQCMKFKKGTVIVVPAGWNYNIISKSDKDVEFVTVNSKGAKNGKNKR